jgi:hypothetical protein
MLTDRVSPSCALPVGQGVTPFSPSLRAMLALWQAEAGEAALPESGVLGRVRWRPWVEHGLRFEVLRRAIDCYGFRAAPFGVVLRAALETDPGPRLLAAESAAGFWPARAVAAGAPLLAYGALEALGVPGRRGEMLFLPFGRGTLIESLFVAVAAAHGPKPGLAGHARPAHAAPLSARA